MTLSELAYCAQDDLQYLTRISLKRSHVYELLAATFGFKSYASFRSQAVFAGLRLPFAQKAPFPRLPDKQGGIAAPKNGESGGAAPSIPGVNLAAQRAEELGYPPRESAMLSSALESLSKDLEIGAAGVADVAEWAASYSFEDGLPPEFISLLTPSYCYVSEGLAAAAGRGSALANYAIAKVYFSDYLDYSACYDDACYDDSSGLKAKLFLEEVSAEKYPFGVPLAHREDEQITDDESFYVESGESHYAPFDGVTYARLMEMSVFLSATGRPHFEGFLSPCIQELRLREQSILHNDRRTLNEERRLLLKQRYFCHMTTALKLGLPRRFLIDALNNLEDNGFDRNAIQKQAQATSAAAKR